MVTQTVICVTPTEAAKLAASESWSSREADSIIKKASTPTNNIGSNERSGNNEELEKQVELQVGFRTIRVQQRGVIRPTSTCTPTQSTNCSTSSSNTDRRFEIDLSDVPPQLPILKTKEYVIEGTSKYTGVHFNKAMNKWHAQISIEGKSRHIGHYEREEEAGRKQQLIMQEHYSSTEARRC